MKDTEQLHPLHNFVAFISLTEKIKEGKETHSPVYRIVLLKGNAHSSLLPSVMNEREDGKPSKCLKKTVETQS